MDIEKDDKDDEDEVGDEGIIRFNSGAEAVFCYSLKYQDFNSQHWLTSPK